MGVNANKLPSTRGIQIPMIEINQCLKSQYAYLSSLFSLFYFGLCWIHQNSEIWDVFAFVA